MSTPTLVALVPFEEVTSKMGLRLLQEINFTSLPPTWRTMLTEMVFSDKPKTTGQLLQHFIKAQPKTLSSYIQGRKTAMAKCPHPKVDILRNWERLGMIGKEKGPLISNLAVYLKLLPHMILPDAKVEELGRKLVESSKRRDFDFETPASLRGVQTGSSVVPRQSLFSKNIAPWKGLPLDSVHNQIETKRKEREMSRKKQGNVRRKDGLLQDSIAKGSVYRVLPGISSTPALSKHLGSEFDHIQLPPVQQIRGQEKHARSQKGSKKKEKVNFPNVANPDGLTASGMHPTTGRIRLPLQKSGTDQQSARDTTKTGRKELSSSQVTNLPIIKASQSQSPPQPKASWQKRSPKSHLMLSPILEKWR
eukprot:Platyproteum_vivax@DN7125_c0_g1_i2.p1